jgi:transposase InsO family protein
MSSHGLPIYPNMAKGMILDNINQLWVSDISYIGINGNFAYLSIVIDAYSRKCVGWHLSKSLKTRVHLGVSGMVHHSDRGVQYASLEYTESLKLSEVQISMSRVGNPYDNAYAESFIKTLKVEEVYQTEYESFKEANEGICKFIESYNRKRLHSSLGYMSPDEFEEQLLKQTKTNSTVLT